MRQCITYDIYFSWCKSPSLDTEIVLKVGFQHLRLVIFMRSMNAEAVLKQRVRNEQTSGEKKSPSKGVLIFYFFPAQMQIFRPIGQTFGSRRERVKDSEEKISQR